LRFLNPVTDTKKTPLLPLEDLADAVTVLLQTGFQHNKEPGKELEKYYKRREPRSTSSRRSSGRALGT
jgi:hypothetical protein